jgi:orotidine-5'-phosphate decarboxylase
MKDVIIACDFSSKEETINFLAQFEDRKPFVKIGMELFYSEGPSIVSEIKGMGHKVFLDLKLHDIPNTVKKAMKNLARLGVDMTNVHAAGTINMMKAAKEGLIEGTKEGQKVPMLIAVTQLTSTDEETMQNELLINSTVNETVAKYALNTKEAGLDGVVCSPLEVEIVKNSCGTAFNTVTPGIRFSTNSNDDQKRVTTPLKASQLGSDFIVVGRSITAAENPVAAYQKCLEDFLGE